MRVRNITTCALGLAAALTLTSDLAAQDTTRLRRPSDQRISISKGEVVAPPRVDTVYVTRYDTVRVDNTIVRVDTVTVAAPVPVIIPEIKEFYWGLFAGPTVPTGNFDRVYTNGFHGGGLIGWEDFDGWWGARLDGTMSQLGRENFLNILTPDNIGSGTPLMWNMGLDLKLKGNFGGWSLYGIGGMNWNSFKRLAMPSDNDNAVTGGEPCGFILRGQCFENANNDGWNNSFGYNFGAGTDFHIGRQDMFIEARWIATPKNSTRAWTVPISLGVRYF